MMRLSSHFRLAEFLPDGFDEADLSMDVLTNLEMLAEDILEPLRAALPLAVSIHAGYRLPLHNAAVGGVPSSDHLTGNAADFHVAAGFERTWQQSTIFAFHWMRTQLLGHFGQLILEDHREHYKTIGNDRWEGKLWIHASNPTKHHPGTDGDFNRILLSWSPTEYEGFDPKKVATG